MRRLLFLAVLIWISHCSFAAAPNDAPPRLVVQSGHSLPIEFLVPSHRGKFLTTAGRGFLDANDQIILWDTTTGKQLQRFHDVASDDVALIFGREVLTLNFSPSDQYLVATFGERQADNRDFDMPSVFRVWNIATGADLLTNAHAPKVRCAIMGHDEQVLFTGGLDGVARVWQLSNGKELKQLRGPTAALEALAVSADDRHLAGVTHEGQLFVWDIATGNLLAKLGESTNEFISEWQIEFSPHQDAVLAWGGNNLGARFWDVQSKRLLWEVKNPQSVRSAQFSPDGKLVLISDHWFTVLVDVSSGKELRTYQSTLELFTPAPEPPQPTEDAIAPPAPALPNLGFEPPETAPVPPAPTPAEPSHDETTEPSAPHPPELSDASTPPPAPPSPDPPTPAGEQPLTEQVAEYSHTLPLGWLPSGAFVQQSGPTELAVLADPLANAPLRTVTISKRQTIMGKSLLAGDSFVRVTGPQEGWFSNNPQQVIFTNLNHPEQDVTPRGIRKLNSVTFHPAGGLTTAADDGAIQHWGVNSEKPSHIQFKLNEDERTLQIVASPDGSRSCLITVETKIQKEKSASRRKATLWNNETNQGIISYYLADQAEGFPVAFSRNGQQLLLGIVGGTALLLEANTGKTLLTLRGHQGEVVSVGWRADGATVVTAGEDKTIRLWNAKTGQQLKSVISKSEFITAVAVSPDGRFLLNCAGTETEKDAICQWQLWDAKTGALLRSARTGLCASAAFSADSVRFCTAAQGTSSGTLWDALTGKSIAVLDNHQATFDLCFSPGGKYLLTVGIRGTVHLWDAKTGASVCELVQFTDGDWAVADDAGRFDASPGGMRSLHWVVHNEPIELEQLKERYFEPGLLAKLLGLNPEPLRPVEAFARPQLFPQVSLTAPTLEHPQLIIHAENRGGGIGRLQVKIGGKEIAADARGPRPDANAQSVDITVDLAHDPRLAPGQPNKIEVQAFNAEGYLASRGLEVLYTPPHEALQPPRLWGLVIGVSKYRGEELALRYASKDAEDFAAGLQIAAAGLLGLQNVHVTLLSSEAAAGDHRPTRDNIQSAFAEISAAKPAPQPNDILVLYLAGHGVNYGGAEGDFYFLTSDALSSDLRDPVARSQAAISSAELTEYIRVIPSQKQVLVLDTCASGRLVEKLTEKRELPSSQIRALERLKDRMGLHVLAGCAADQVSYETSRYAQGLLTYSLLMGMRGAALREEEYLDVDRWFNFAADEVPRLSRDLGGIQRPILAAPTGGASFDIGRLTSSDKPKIPLQTVKPLVIRASFQDADLIRDRLGITKQVNDKLRSLSARGRGAELVFVDTEEFPGAYELVGRYRAKDSSVNVAAKLIQANQAIDFQVHVDSLEPSVIADQILSAAQVHLMSHPLP